MRVQRCARRLRVLGDQLEVAERGDGRDQEGHQERNPRRATDFGGDVAGQRVHAGAEDVADDEQQQQARAHHPLQFRLLVDRVRLAHCLPPLSVGCEYPIIDQHQQTCTRNGAKTIQTGTGLSWMPR